MLRPERLRTEIAEYDPAKGILRAWVNLPALSHLEDSVFFLSYGASEGEPEEAASPPRPAGGPEGEKKGIRIPHSESLALKEDLAVEELMGR